MRRLDPTNSPFNLQPLIQKAKENEAMIARNPEPIGALVAAILRGELVLAFWPDTAIGVPNIDGYAAAVLKGRARLAVVSATRQAAGLATVALMFESFAHAEAACQAFGDDRAEQAA